MEKVNNVVNFDLIKNPNEPENKLEEFFEGIKGNVFKAAYFVKTKDGNYAFGCTEESKVGQERMLYHLRNLIQFYIETYPDYEQEEADDGEEE